MSAFSLEDSITVLERTPAVLRALLAGLPVGWTTCTEGGASWSAYDVVGHLIHGERADWNAQDHSVDSPSCGPALRLRRHASG
jgi:hypothetical protein